LYDADLKAVGRMAQGQNGGAHPVDIAVMIRSPEIDDLIKAALVFVLMVGDVDEKIGRFAGAGDQHPVLFIAEGRAPEPDGPLRIVDVASFPE